MTGSTNDARSGDPAVWDHAARDHAALGHRNLITFHRACTSWSGRGVVEDGQGVLLCAGGSWIPMVGNVAFRIDDTVSPTELLSRAGAFFERQSRGFSVKVRDTPVDDDLRAACEAAGLLQFGEAVPHMLRRAPLPDRRPGAGITVRPIDDETGLRGFIAVNAEAYATYGMPAETLSELFDQPDVFLADTDTYAVLAQRDGEPVATAMTYLADGVASVQWVGTVPAGRQLGLGALVTTMVTNAAFARGATSVTLQASPMGEPVYAALGYETIYRYAEYVRWPDPSAV